MSIRFLTVVIAFFVSTVHAIGQESKFPVLGLKTYMDDLDPLLEWYDELMGNSELVKELELTDAQIEELQTNLRKRLEWMRAERPKHIDDKAEFQEKMLERWKDETRGVLLPHQLLKLEQLAYRDARKQKGTAGLLSLKWFRERIGISDEQLTRIHERAEKEKVKLEETIAKARKEAEENVLDELTPEQKKKIKELLGDEKE